MTSMELENMDKRTVGNGSSENQKPPYPKAVFFIIAAELSERFSYYGMRAVLTIYMRNMLQFNEDEATTLYHTFLLLCYGLPVVWGILADSIFGKFTTIWMVSICFAVGNIVLMLSSVPPLNLPAIPLTMVGLLLMAIGTGGMKPCVAPFGGEQFLVPQQERQMKQFFSVFFFAMTVGNMISTVITPVFRRDVHCFGVDSCYPLAFGVPALIMVLSVVIFTSGKSLYKIHKPTGNVLVQVAKCMTYAWGKEKTLQNEKSHWLDRASDKYDAQLIKDIKGLFRVLVYYLPIPMFFALYEQLGSRWTLQATRMTGVIGSFTIKPDQMQVFNAILMFIFIPVFQGVIYPIFAKCNLLRKPLQRMGVGGFLAAFSFLVAGIVETQIEKSYYVPPGEMETHANFINTIPCSIRIEGAHINTSFIGSNESLMIPFLKLDSIDVMLKLNESCFMRPPNSSNGTFIWQGHLKLIPGAVQSIIIYDSGDHRISVLNANKPDDLIKSNEGNAKFRIVSVGFASRNLNLSRVSLIDSQNHSMSFDMNAEEKEDSHDGSHKPTWEMHPDLYDIAYNFTHSNTTPSSSSFEGRINLLPGASYLLILYPSDDRQLIATQLVILTRPNDIHMLWLLPQYILMAWAEILFIVSGMEFSFTQAPTSMKSVLQSMWHLMNAFGNVIVIISAQGKHNSFQANEFFGFSAAMFVDTILFCLLAMRYKYVIIASKEDKNGNI